MNTIPIEMIAVESVDGNVLDPERDVPFAAMCETYGTLLLTIGIE